MRGLSREPEMVVRQKAYVGLVAELFESCQALRRRQDRVTFSYGHKQIPLPPDTQLASMSQAQTINVTDLDIAQLSEVRKQLEDVNILYNYLIDLQSFADTVQ